MGAPETIADLDLRVFMTVVVMLANALWYYVKVQLRQEGKEVSWFVDHFRDYRSLRELIAEAHTDEKRRRFQRLLIALYSLPVLVLACFAALVASVLART